jgi:hypothetical protein
MDGLDGEDWAWAVPAAASKPAASNAILIVLMTFLTVTVGGEARGAAASGGAPRTGAATRSGAMAVPDAATGRAAGRGAAAAVRA